MTLTRLPLFPLPLVLFPGATLPLHIFEQRYRRLLVDCLAGARCFGSVRLREHAAEDSLGAGAVGCVAEILRTDTLADGRSNVLVRGAQRFELLELLEMPAPYRVCRARSYEDDEAAPGAAPAALTVLAERIRVVFQRVGTAARALADDPDPLPGLPNDPGQLSFAIAAAIDLDVDTRQQLLESRSPWDRLRRLDAVLTPALGTLGARAQVHTLAKSNGRGSQVQP